MSGSVIDYPKDMILYGPFGRATFLIRIGDQGQSVMIVGESEPYLCGLDICAFETISHAIGTATIFSLATIACKASLRNVMKPRETRFASAHSELVVISGEDGSLA